MSQEININTKLMCNNCGLVIERGLFNVTEHQFNCGAKRIEKITDGISATIHPFVSFTEIEEADFEVVKPLLIENKK